MGPKNLEYNKDARAILLSGVNDLANAVKVTLGAKGRNVCIGNLYGNTPHNTKDGVTVAKNIRFKDMQKDMGAVMVKDVAIKTAETAGDGTTTATILAQSIITQGVEAIDAGANPIDIKKGIDQATLEVVKFIKSVSRPVNAGDERIRSVATISSNNDVVLGDIIAIARKQVGNDGEIYIQDSGTHETTVETVNGMRFERGFISPHFINIPDKNKCELMNPYIVFIDRKLTFVKELLPLLQMVSEEKRSLLIVCDDLADEALQTVLHNKNRGAVIVGAIKCPEIGIRRKMLMDDLATICGGVFITEDMGIKLDKIKKEQLGQANRVIIDRYSTLIAGGYSTDEKRAELVANIKGQIEDAQDNDEKEFLRSRLAKIQNGVAILKIGGVTPLEIEEKKDRIDDALRATKCAVEEGVVAGGGVTYLHGIIELNKFVIDNKDVKKGYEIVKKALASPFRQLLLNGGMEEKEIDFTYESIIEGKYGTGYNQKSEKIENLLECGVLDPTTVARVALENAASVSGMFLLTECIISDVAV